MGCPQPPISGPRPGGSTRSYAPGGIGGAADAGRTAVSSEMVSSPPVATVDRSSSPPRYSSLGPPYWSKGDAPASNGAGFWSVIGEGYMSSLGAGLLVSENDVG